MAAIFKMAAIDNDKIMDTAKKCL